MALDHEAAQTASRPEVTEVSEDRRLGIYGYIGFLVLLLPFTGISHTTVTFYLQNQLHQSPGEIATFWFIAAIPAYVGFLFGYLRDRWAPFGRRDQGILILVSAVMVGLFLLLAGAKLTVQALLLASLAKVICDQMMGGVVRGLTSAFGQGHVMSGRLVSVWQAVGGVPGLCVHLIGGYLAVHYAPSQTFLLAGLVALGVFGFSLLRPRVIYEDPVELQPLMRPDLLRDVTKLITAPGILPCIVLMFLWNFTPGVGTPIQFFLTQTLHGTAEDYGRFNAIFGGFFIPTYLLHGFLSTRMKLHRILWISTFFAVPQIVPLMFVHSAASALWVGIPMGLMGGFATAAYYDLLVRACPAGLQGTAMMLGGSVWVLSGQLGDLAGAAIYGWGGFTPCAWATVAVYACLIPTLLFVPRYLTASRDGEVVPAAA